MTALYLHPLTLGIFFQNIGNLSGDNALAVPRKDVFAFTWDFMQDFQRFGDKYYKPVLIGLCVLHNFVAVCSLVAHFLTEDMEAVSLNVGLAQGNEFSHAQPGEKVEFYTEENTIACFCKHPVKI